MISVVPVGLPDGGMFDVVDHFMETLQVTSSSVIDSFLSKCLWSSARVAEMISVVSVGLPDGGMFDVVDHFMKTLQFTSSW